LDSKRSFYRRNRKTLITLLIILFTVVPIFSQEENEEEIITAGIQELDSMESWLLFEKGIFSYDMRKYGESLNFFNKLIERHGVYPEAEYWIGRVFEQEGEYILAEKQYLKALEAERTLLIPHEKYEIKYRLAQLYKNLENYDSYKQILNSIVIDELEVNQLALANENAAINTLKRDGIDRTLLLFRHEFSYSIDSFNQLGVYYYKTGDYKGATSKLIYPLLSLFSIAVDYLRDLDPEFVYPEDLDVLLEDHPDYVFDTLEYIIQRKNENFIFVRDLETLEVINKSEQFKQAETLLPAAPEFYLSGASYCLGLFNKEPSLKKLIGQYNIYKNMYYLAASLYAEGYSETAFRIWEIVQNDSNSHMWGRKSFEQLQDPEVEIGLTIF
jgi:tetratricopeptide (TPR) repeat protein